MSALSRLIGRNPAYIQQYLRRGTPKALPERERRLLADYFRVDETELGGPEQRRDQRAPLRVPRIDVAAAAGAGGLVEDERDATPFHFDPAWLRQLSARPEALSIIRVEGESMAPTLTPGDDIMVDASDGIERLRDGIYVLRRDDVLLVKRLKRSGLSGSVDIVSDNPAWPTDAAVSLSTLTVIGRVVWAGRRLG